MNHEPKTKSDLVELKQYFESNIERYDSQIIELKQLETRNGHVYSTGNIEFMRAANVRKLESINKILRLM